MQEREYRPQSPQFVRRLSDKTCPACGQDFRPRAAVQKFCSKECYLGGEPPSLSATLCEAPGCDRPKRRRQYCGAHYARMRRYGHLQVEKPVKTINWGSGHTISPGGYRRVYAPRVEGADSNGYIFEHRLVMAQAIGRALTAEETVHHRNGDRLDNRPENLELYASRHPRGQSVSDLIDYAQEILALYAPERLR